MKTFLSIGSGPGIGFATAERFAREGFRVILSARNIERTTALADLLNRKGYAAEARSLDVIDVAGIGVLVTEVEASFGGIDVVHYNAASMREASILTQLRDTFITDLSINVGGALATAQAVLPKMRERSEGSILLTGGGFGLYPNPDYLSLSLGKAAIRALAIGLFEPCKAQGIHVGAVTVKALISAGSPEADGVADKFWMLHSQVKADWAPEIDFPN